jgi:hypothetical protein
MHVAAEPLPGSDKKKKQKGQEILAQQVPVRID